MLILYTEKKPKKHSEHKSKKEKEVDEIDAGKIATPGKAAIKDEGEQQPAKSSTKEVQPQTKTAFPLGQTQPTSEMKVESQPQTKPVFSLEQSQPVGVKKADSQNLPQTPTTSIEKEQLTAAPEKKVYPKEKHPRATKSPKFGQRMLVAPPKEKPLVRPEPVMNPSEQKRFETKALEVTKPVERMFSPHRKAPEPPIERASPKPKTKVIRRAY